VGDQQQERVLLAVCPQIRVSMAGASRGTELEGALQYPPSSIGKDAQPAKPTLSGIAISWYSLSRADQIPIVLTEHSGTAFC